MLPPPAIGSRIVGIWLPQYDFNSSTNHVDSSMEGTCLNARSQEKGFVESFLFWAFASSSNLAAPAMSLSGGTPKSLRTLFLLVFAGKTVVSIAALEAARGRRANHTCKKYRGGKALLALLSRILSMLASVIGNQSSIRECFSVSAIFFKDDGVRVRIKFNGIYLSGNDCPLGRCDY